MMDKAPIAFACLYFLVELDQIAVLGGQPGVWMVLSACKGRGSAQNVGTAAVPGIVAHR